jgi:hypothetical protein
MQQVRQHDLYKHFRIGTGSLNMSPEFKAQSCEPLAVRKNLNEHRMISNPSVAADGFNIWWQKTAALNMAMVAEAYELIRAHRLVRSARQPRARQAD